MLLYADTVTRVRAPYKVDKYGNTSTERDWTKAERTALSDVSFQPDSSTENTGDRGSVVTGYRLFTPRGRDVDLLPTDRVEAFGMTLEVDGEIARYRVGGRIHHVEARFKKVTG
ncbi:hypothetical protein [Streptomyces sp. NRRL S-475]|uniref:hypothetical protein n=1 Tax=Streptomyces sp. NRRL S-475 TaxID=1463910 RepID=UPI00131DA485|nr:hypothetical protein [Streptomyces sp. NRRL S-475]